MSLSELDDDVLEALEAERSRPSPLDDAAKRRATARLVGMVTTLPRIHVVLMGMERIVPTPADLAVMLQVLARSATGQKMSVYTSLTSGPRRPDEPHGPEQVHVIILDNGRSKALAGEMAEILYCIRCGACFNACPVYRAIGGHAYGSVYSGPVGAVVSPILGGVAAHGDLPHASTLCGACQEVCPVRIDLPGLLLKLRRQTVEAGQAPAWLKMGLKGFAAAITYPSLIALAQKMAGLLLSGNWKEKLPGPAREWKPVSVTFPRLARNGFRINGGTGWKTRSNHPKISSTPT